MEQLTVYKARYVDGQDLPLKIHVSGEKIDEWIETDYWVDVTA